LLGGRTDQHERLVASARRDGLEALAVALDRGLRSGAPLPPFSLGGRDFALGQRTRVMGILNVTPDSFSDGGELATIDDALARAQQMVSDGADLLDIGGESTRPGSRAVSADEESSRVVPVIQALKERFDVPLSIDTMKSQVAREALKVGAVLVNDVSGLSADPQMAAAAAEAGAALCVMHMQGTPATMQQNPAYDDVVAEVIAQLHDAVARAEAAGVKPAQILVDPGIGFGKTPGHNLFLLRRLNDLRVLGRPILVGTSRKSFLGHLTGEKDPKRRVQASAASVAALAAVGSVDVVRVHDVAAAREALAVADAIRQAREGGAHYGAAPRLTPGAH
jgi:dihydropteroate synthase